MVVLPNAYDCVSMLHSAASGKQVLSRLEWALEDEAGQDAGFPLPSPAGWSAGKSLAQAAGQPYTWPAAGRAIEAAWAGSEGSPPDTPAQCFCLCRTSPEGRSWLVCQVLPVQVTPDRKVRMFFSLQEVQGMSVPAVGHDCGTAKALACSAPLRCGLVAPAGFFCLHKCWYGAASPGHSGFGVLPNLSRYLLRIAHTTERHPESPHNILISLRIWILNRALVIFSSKISWDAVSV